MDEMMQVSGTVATVALLLLILTQLPEIQSRLSNEAIKITHNIDAAMGSMERNFEAGFGIDSEESRIISDTFAKLGDYIKKETNQIRNQITLPKGTKNLILDILSNLL
uniref:Uncharacterized protein LOC108043741 n=1 Tax=Drosophila rhopaloa TaxID=1041015 RepID=A0A6P4EIL0_DRORH